MRLHRLTGSGGYANFGCMWAKGECLKDSGFVCRNDDGAIVPMQSRITAYWPDGSIKWTAHTADSRRLSENIEVLPTQDRETGMAGIAVFENESSYKIDNGLITIDIPKSGSALVNRITRNGGEIAGNFRPELIIEQPFTFDGDEAVRDRRFEGKIDGAVLEESGAQRCIVRYTGTHVDRNAAERFRFVIRMEICHELAELKFTHTFIYDGEPDKDFLKGLSVAFDVPMRGELYNRHIKFTPDHGVFHESAVTLISWRPRVPFGMHETQIKGGLIKPLGDEAADMERIMSAIPFWDTYDICQDSDSHFMIRKKLAGRDLCYIDCLNGGRAHGGIAVGSEAGSVAVAMRDFWEKYPSGYTVSGLTADSATVNIHLWSPSARPFDFRHYAERGYNQVCYEGYDYKGADPYGIACTSEFSVNFEDKLIHDDSELLQFTEQVDTPVIYVAEPKEYHDLRAFGYWSLPACEAGRTKLGDKLEKELDTCFEFYKNEVEQRKWYGMFNYGDFMHTYDSVRHVWRYDVGGYAWDNTELVPTLWLWYYFMRTGRADVFKLAEKLTRHASEVDVYHIGKYKGMGSRHNVIHWGCPCKEARIAMAGHHRFFYYLTGDRRLEDIFDELKDNEATFLNRDPLGDFYPRNEMVEPSHARTGPDWSSLCSNWVTQWERTGDTAYRDKIVTGSDDIKAAPLKLVSGPDFEFNPGTLHLRYIGERTTGGTHLQICMGAPSIWMEMADLLEDEEWKDMMAEYGRFYFLPEEEKQRESKGLIGDRQFTIPMFATGIGAYGAARLKDEVLAGRVWKTLLDSQYRELAQNGFEAQTLKDTGNMSELTEIPRISTNHAAQFCLNTIMVLEFLEARD